MTIDNELGAAWKYQVRRKREALDALAGLGEDVAVDLTDTTMTAARFVIHGRSEAADPVGTTPCPTNCWPSRS